MYERVSAMAKIGVWECDLETEALTWTDAVYDLFDLPRGSKVDREAALACYEPASRRKLETLRAEAVRSGSGFRFDIAIRTAKGTRKWIRLTADIEQEEGRSVRIFGTKQDISEEVLAQQQVSTLQAELIHLARLNAMNSMASTLAHEINQPLAAVANYMAAANRMVISGGSPPGLSECIDGAMESALRAGDIIRRVREMTGKGPAARDDLDMDQIVSEAVSLATAGHDSVSVTCDIGPDIRLQGDRIQIQQVLLNLLQNCLDAAGERPCQIAIRAWRDDGCVTICVSDDGPGVPADMMPFIFDATTTSKPAGLGIGLSVCRTIVERHGGHITATNGPEGGACICVTLPSSENHRSLI